MAGWTTKINGVSYRATIVAGKTVYDPPLPDEQIARDKQRMREMAKAGKAPGCVTDSTFFAGVGTLDKQFADDPAGLARIVAKAKAKGYTPMPGDFYQPGLADDEGDPQAFVKSRGEVQERCIERGVPCEGSCKVTDAEAPARPERARKRRVTLGKDIVARHLRERQAANPELNVKTETADIIEKHGGNHVD